MNTTTYIKLISGEELIGMEAESGIQHNAPFRLFENLALINVAQGTDGHFGIQLIPWPMVASNNEPVRIYQSAIALEAEPSDEFLNHYRTQFGKLAGFQFANNLSEFNA